MCFPLSLSLYFFLVGTHPAQVMTSRLRIFYWHSVGWWWKCVWCPRTQFLCRDEGKLFVPVNNVGAMGSIFPGITVWLPPRVCQWCGLDFWCPFPFVIIIVFVFFIVPASAAKKKDRLKSKSMFCFSYSRPAPSPKPEHSRTDKSFNRGIASDARRRARTFWQSISICFNCPIFKSPGKSWNYRLHSHILSDPSTNGPLWVQGTSHADVNKK